MMGLTPRQAECLAFIKSFMGSHEGLSPAFQEIMDGMGLSSKGEVHRLVSGLEKRGRIRRMYHRNRAIEVIEDTTPDFSAMTDAGLEAAFMAAMNELKRRREARA